MKKLFKLALLMSLFMTHFTISYAQDTIEGCDITLQTSGTTLNLVNSNITGDFKIKLLPNGGWAGAFTYCDDYDGDPMPCTSPNASDILDVGYYKALVTSSNGQCEIEFTISEDECTSGIDGDNDGICQEDDCDDNNPEIPATPGTPCDDNDPETTGDVIQSNGCDCSGIVDNGKTRIGCIGDFGDFTVQDYDLDETNEDEVAELVKSWNPVAIITLGDNNYDDGLESTIDDNIGQFYSSFIYPYDPDGDYGPGATTNKFWPALGNHDWKTRDDNGLPFVHTEYFSGLPNNKRYYDFKIDEAHFFCIDSDPHEPDGNYYDLINRPEKSIQALWLKEQLANSTAQWKIVYFHHPPYTSGDENSHSNYTRMQWPFAEWGADAVLTGHNHHYERLSIDGIPYFVNGLGGRKYLNGFADPLLDESQETYNETNGAMLLEYDSECFIFKFINIEDEGAPQEIQDIHILTANNSCAIVTSNFNTQCDDNGTEDENDDTFSLSLNPSGINLGSNYNVIINDEEFGPFNYGNDQVIDTDFLITSGDLSIEIIDNQDADCSYIETIPAPAPCSGCGNGPTTFTVEGCGITLQISGTTVTVADSEINGSFKLKVLPEGSWSNSFTFCDDYDDDPMPCMNPSASDNFDVGYYKVIVTGGGEQCSDLSFTITDEGSGGIDADGDGFCDDEDCDDNNPDIPANPGSPCDDDNGSTTNDVIQADGCTCLGETDGEIINIPLPECASSGGIASIILNGNILTINMDGANYPGSSIKIMDLSDYSNTLLCANWTGGCDGSVLSPTLDPGDYTIKLFTPEKCYIDFTVPGFSMREDGGSKSMSNSNNSNLLNEVVVSPNPTSDRIIIKNFSQESLTKISLYSIEGKLLIQKNADLNNMNLEGLSSGVYFLQIESNIASKMIKIFKE